MKTISLLFFISVSLTSPHIAAQTTNDLNPLTVFDETTDIVTKRFYDQTFRSLNWPALVAEARTKIATQSSEEKLKSTLNDLLSLLHASHTEFLSNTDQEFWALKSVFSTKLDGGPLYQIGAWFDHVDDNWFVRNVFEGSPAFMVGLKAGDEIISVDGKPLEPVTSFTPSQSHKTMVIRVRRKTGGSIHNFRVTPQFESFQRMMLDASLKSARIFHLNGRRIGYFHLWAGTNDAFKEALKNMAIQFANSTDAMVLDIRDGFGGARPEYLNPFFAKDDQGKPIQPIYSKPVVTIINGGVRSGKEWLAYILKEQKRGPLVGTRTKGYFLGGQYNEIVPNKYVLYLAVGQSPDLPQLEGKGVEPDIWVGQTLPYSAGKDSQLKRALSILENENANAL